MADTITLNAGSGGAVLATDDIAGVHYQIVKLTYGALDSQTLVDTTNRFPTSAAQSGTWNITNVSGTISLPTGAATAAKQPALGTAGTASSDVISVQGIASMTPLQIGDNSSSITVDAPVATPVFVRLSDGASAISALPITDNAGSITVDGTVTANIAAGTNNIGDVDVLTVPADPFGANADAASATGSISAKLRFIASTGIPITGTVTVGSHNVTNAGTFATQAAQSGTWTVQPGNTANTTAWLVNDQPATSGGLSFSAVPVSAATNNKTQAKASAGQLYSISAQNISASVRYLKIFNNTSAGVTMGTTACDYQFIIPGSTTGAGVVINFDKGIAMGTGITYAITGGISATDNTSIGASEVSVIIGYK